MASDKKGGKSKKTAYKIARVYEVSGNSLNRKNKTCPKCNVFMANHKGRKVCGKCGYAEFE